MYRLGPMLQNIKSHDKDKYNKNWVFYCSDRVGKEENTTFQGSTCAIKVNPLEVVQYLDKREEGYLMTDVILLS